jgi:hypothetical protein
MRIGKKKRGTVKLKPQKPAKPAKPAKLLKDINIKELKAVWIVPKRTTRQLWIDI